MQAEEIVSLFHATIWRDATRTVELQQDLARSRIDMGLQVLGLDYHFSDSTDPKDFEQFLEIEKAKAKPKPEWHVKKLLFNLIETNWKSDLECDLFLKDLFDSMKMIMSDLEVKRQQEKEDDDTESSSA